jgi:DNA recombination protein RmuC
MDTVLYLLFIVIILLVIIVSLQVTQFKRKGLDLSPLDARLDAIQEAQERTDRSLRDEIARSRADQQMQAHQERTELAVTLKAFGETVQRNMTEIAKLQNEQMESFSRQLSLLTSLSERKMEEMRGQIDAKLKQIQEDNARQLDRMRETVDEKLQGTLERRLGESFKQVSERLELVHQGLGDMRQLAAGVGDLKKVLTNVKTRGTWGEVQLGALLEEMLSPEQYARNVKIHEHGSDFVEFAIKLPAQDDTAEPMWIPVDAKFPLEDYSRLVEAQERADAAGAEEALRQLDAGIKKAAKDISQKYLLPPKTTDFGIMFLPSEGLYAEVIRRQALVQQLQRDHHIVVVGPSIFAAFLNALQMGFRTLAIQRRSGEVWKVLGEVKTAFGRFGDALDAVHKKLEQAATSVEDARKKSKTLQNKLRSVEALPESAPAITISDPDVE